MRLFSKFNGVPNSHLFIAVIYLILGVLACISVILNVIQGFLDSSFMKANICFISPYAWLYIVVFGICIAVIIGITDIIFIYLGYWSRYQMPLHRVVRAFYKKDDSTQAVDSSGTPYTLSDSELADRNKAVRNAYLKPCRNGLLFVIPCSRWGFIGTASSVIDRLRDNKGSLDLAQRVVSDNFKDYRFQISHYSFKEHFIIWLLVKK